MYCIWRDYIVTTKELADGAFWKVQNSWGEDWGHNGFAYFKVEGTSTEFPNGYCNMYDYGASYVITENEY